MGPQGPTGPPGSNQLLDNWYFADPINQRGQTEYTAPASSTSYTIDRWLLGGGNIIHVLDDGLQLSNPESLPRFAFMGQRLEANTMSVLRGNLATFSIIVKGHGTITLGVTNQPSTQQTFEIDGDIWTLASHTFTWVTAITVWSTCIMIACVSGTVTIKAAKLELGSQQTLAHQDASGNWVLNDPPPNRALELLKCQRYQLFYNGAYSPFGCGFMALENYLIVTTFTPVNLRTAPSVVSEDSILRFVVEANSGGVEVYYFTVESTRATSVCANVVQLGLITKPALQTTTIPVGLRGTVDFENIQSFLLLDANL